VTFWALEALIHVSVDALNGQLMKAMEVVTELKRRNHATLYHACTLETFRSYCRLDGYHSRAHVREANLPLTPQASDDVDRALGIDEHLFLNVFDQHGDVHKGRSVTGINKYGPILMVFDVDAIANYRGELKGYKKEISAPQYSAAAHDVITVEDFRQNTFHDAEKHSQSSAPSRRPGTPGPNMCLHCAEELGGVPFKPFLREVIVDTFAGRYQGLQDTVIAEVNALVRAHTPHSKVTQRQCVSGCDCEYGYGEVLTEDEVKKFLYVSNQVVYTKSLRRRR
jgi:hypothetical protein